MGHQLFGTRFATRVDYFAFPRTGSHYLSYLLTGLFDLVFFEIEGQDSAEVASRSDELEPWVLYALKLREDGVPFQPLYLDHTPLGVHQAPDRTGSRTMILIRDPRSTLYSWLRLQGDRLGSPVVDPGRWLDEQWARYQHFYRRALGVRAASPGQTLVLRYEQLVGSVEPLDQICSFLELRPKLRASFVHRLLDFENVVRSDIERTFYRCGPRDSWREAPEFLDWLGTLAGSPFAEFGY